MGALRRPRRRVRRRRGVSDAGHDSAARDARRTLAALGALGLAGAPLYVAAYRLGSMPFHPFAFSAIFAALCALYGAACRLALRGPERLPYRAALIVVAGVAVVYRLIFLPAVPSLSDDFFRYVWDGAIQRAGYSPYRFPPAAAELAPLRDDYFWPKINRKEQTSAYPPVAEVFFRALAAIRPLDSAPFKVAFLACDLLTIALLVLLLRARGQSPLAVVVYAWHPLPVFEFVHSAHVDALAVMLLTLALVLQARGRSTLAGVALGLATLTKLYPGLLLPAFARRGQWRLPAAAVLTVAAGFAPALLAGDTNFRQLPTYLGEEGYGSGARFLPLALLGLDGPLAATLYVLAVAVALLALSLWLYRRPDAGGAAGAFDVPRRALLLAAAIVLLVTPDYPWYFIWLLPLLAVTPVPTLLYLTGAVALNYVGWWWLFPRGWSLVPLAALQFLPVYGAVLWRLATRARRADD